MRPVSILLKILLFCLVVCAARGGAFAQEEAAPGNKWLKLHSKNFQLVGDADEAHLRRVATRLEQFRQVFAQFFPNYKFASPIPTRVVVFRDQKSFDRFKTIEWAAGYFQPGEDVNYIVLSAEGGERDDYSTIFHEYTHFLIDNSLGRAVAPPWLNEGIAEYYERFAIENDRRVTLGAAHAGNLQILQKTQAIPFEEFFAADYYTLHKQSKERAQLFYAQSWLLVHYLLQGNGGANRAAFDKFVAMLGQGAKPKEAFELAFQTNFAALENDLKNYAAQKSFASTDVSFRERLAFDSEMQTFPVSEAEAKAVQGDLLFHIKRFDEAEKHLLEALAADPDSGAANMTLGLVKARQQKFAEAKAYLEKAIRTDSRNYLVFYNYALAISRESMTEFGFASSYSAADAEKIRANLRKSIALNPNFAENYNLYAFVNIIRNEEIDESIKLIDKALAIAPGNQWYQIRLAELYMRKENFAGARALAMKIMTTAPDERVRLYAENSVRTINSLEAQLFAVRNYKKRPDPEEVTDEPMSDEEIARRREKAMLESLNTTLRKSNPDEKRLLGKLTNVECRLTEVIFSVKTENEILRLQTDSLERLKLISFAPEFVNAEFACGAMSKENLAVITYRPTAGAKAAAAGEIVAIEFVPKYFRFLGEKR